MNIEKKKCDFYAVMDNGNCFKSPIEVLEKLVSIFTCKISNNGVHIRSANRSESVLLDISYSELREYKCLKERIIQINIKTLLKLIKTVKKKDKLVLYIEKDSAEADKGILSIGVMKKDSDNIVEVIHVNYTEMNEFDYKIAPLPDGPEYYDDMKVRTITHQDLSKLKKFTDINREIVISQQLSEYLFIGSYNGICANGLFFGKLVTEIDEKIDGIYYEAKTKYQNGKKTNDDTKYPYLYEHTYEASTFKALSKLSALDSPIRFYAPMRGDWPLIKLKLNIGMHGTIKIYIKTMEQITLEKKKKLNEPV